VEDLACQALVELVTDYLEDALPPAERARFDAHLAGCGDCETYLAQIRAVIAVARAGGEFEAAPEISDLLNAFSTGSRVALHAGAPTDPRPLSDAAAPSEVEIKNADLYRRGVETLLASWEEYARGAAGAALRRFPGVAAAVFPNEPERAVYNNALLERDLGADDRADALDAMEAVYAGPGITRFAAWVHEGDEAMRRDLESRGYTLDDATRAMGMPLGATRVPRPEIELGQPHWTGYLRIIGVPPDFLGGADPTAFHVLIGRLDGEDVATAMAFDRAGDCGIYNVTTVERARRRGLGSALTALHVHEALARGCETASLQATEMAAGVYTAVGFRDLGRILEYVP
jgi:ribosomal protein S18 acetylase RimI-like enzyme